MDIAETVETIQIIAVAVQIPKVISRSIKLVQIHAVMMQRFRQIAKAAAKIRPAQLPRSHAQGKPGQMSVSERRNDTNDRPFKFIGLS
ncbi:MAG TPA: hypothetical protein DEB70_01075 [Planctomycetaceae bacterium]|nr:hypothetical protein [Planctomycetaceae bacterium]